MKLTFVSRNLILGVGLFMGTPAWAQPRPAAPFTADVFPEHAAPYAAFRIPSLVVSARQTLLAFAEGRNSPRDQAGNDIVLKRSLDGGRAWSDITVIAEEGQASFNNPQAVVLRAAQPNIPDGRILLMYQRYPAGVREAAAKPGLDPLTSCLSYVTFSDDDGLTWAGPRDITGEIKRPEAGTIAGGPGVAIQLTQAPHAGRIVEPFNQRVGNRWDVYTVYSDDGAQTWRIGQLAPAASSSSGMPNEVQMVELSDGRLLLNCRMERGELCRAVSLSSDGGENWLPVVDDPRLVDPHCMGSLVRYSWTHKGEPGILLFSNPADPWRRVNGTIRASYDDGRTWTVERAIDGGGPNWVFIYSCLAPLPDGTIGCLYESENTGSPIRFTRFTMEWLTEGDSPPN